MYRVSSRPPFTCLSSVAACFEVRASTRWCSWRGMRASAATILSTSPQRTASLSALRRMSFERLHRLRRHGAFALIEQVLYVLHPPQLDKALLAEGGVDVALEIPLVAVVGAGAEVDLLPESGELTRPDSSQHFANGGRDRVCTSLTPIATETSRCAALSALTWLAMTLAVLPGSFLKIMVSPVQVQVPPPKKSPA